MRLRQVALTISTENFKDGVEKVTSNLESYVTYSDPHIDFFGLRNVLIPLKHAFLEIVSPLKGHEKTSPAGRYMQKNGEGGYMLLVQLDTVEQMRHAYETAKENGWIIHEGARVLNKDGSMDDSVKFSTAYQDESLDGIFGIHLHPKAVGVIIELTLSRSRNSWLWAGVDWQTDNERTKISHCPSLGYARVEVACNDPKYVAGNWRSLLQLPDDRVLAEDKAVTLTLHDSSKLTFCLPSGKGGRTGLIRTTVYTEKRNKHNNSFHAHGADFAFVNEFTESSKL